MLQPVMAKDDPFIEAEALAGHKVWVCVHCGAINPAKAGTSCSHYQLAMFENLDGEALEAVRDLSQARRTLHMELGRFNERLKGLISQGTASIGPGAPAKKPESQPGHESHEDLVLEASQPRKPRPLPSKPAPRPKRKEVPVDPRQLALMAFIKPGDA